MATTEHWFKEGFAQHQAGRFERAEQLYRRVLRTQPRHARALYLLGSLHAQRGEWADALTILDHAIAANPNSVEARSNRGIALKELGRFDDAISSYDAALAVKPDYAEAHNNKGVAQLALGRWKDAVAAFDAALSHKPHYAEAFHNRGLAFKDGECFDDAISSYDAALAVKPDYAEAHNNKGVALQKVKRFAEAIQSHQNAVALNPSSAEAHNNLGAALEELGCFDEADAAFDAALAINPNYADALCNLGNSLQAQGRLSEAVAHYDRALTLPIDTTHVRWNRALTLLLSGDLESGFAAYECRFAGMQVTPAYAEFPRWTGEDLTGRTLLVHAEQGFGDTLQFFRFLPHVKNSGARVVFECQHGLKTLLDGSNFCDVLVERGPNGEPPSDLPPFDCQIPLLSLPAVFGTTLTAIPDVLQLSAPPSRAADWGAQIDDAARQMGASVKIGLVWAGNPTHKNDHNRSARLADFAPLAALPGVALFSLQRGPAAAELGDLPPGMRVVNVGEAVSDFADTAAVLENLDLLIAVDTSVAHLAGALNRPVWTLLPHAPDWRWMTGRADTPWYESMRLFRQAKTADWSDVIAEMRQSLTEMLENSPKNQETKNRETGNLTAGEAAFAAGNLAEAAKYFENALTENPNDVRAWNDVAVLAYAQGDLDAAFAALNRALERDPENKTARKNWELCAAARQNSGENPQVSIVMPCWNQAHFLPDAVGSVLSQTYENWDLTIVDDGSPDNTASVAEKLIAQNPGKKIKLLRQQNAGLSMARNAGINQTNGTLILPLDADDTIAPTMLEKCVAALKENPDAAVAYTDVHMFGMEEGLWRTGPFGLTAFREETKIQYGALYRRSLFDAIGGYKPLEAYEDWDFWLRALEHGATGIHIGEPLLHYRKTAGSKLTRDNQRRPEFLAEMTVRHRELYDAGRVKRAETLLAEARGPHPPALEDGPHPPAPSPNSGRGGAEKLSASSLNPRPNLGEGGPKGRVRAAGVTLVAETPHPELAALLESAGWTVTQRETLPTNAADVIVLAAAPESPLMSALAARPTGGQRVIVLPDVGGPLSLDNSQAEILRAAFNRADAVVAGSEDGWDARLLSALHVPGVVMPALAETVSTPAGDFRARFGIPEDAALLVCPGEFRPERDAAALLDALRETPGDWRLILVGSAVPEWPDLPAHLAYLAGLDGRVTLISDADSLLISGALAAANLLLLPSKVEPTPSILTDALRFGLPFVATPMCGSASQFSGGLVVPISQFADAVAFLLTDCDASRALSDAARAHFDALQNALPARWNALLSGVALPPLPKPADALTATFQVRESVSIGGEKRPKISVVIPTFNRAKLLKRVLESYENQTLAREDFEVVVVDDGSSDETITLLQNYKASYQFVWESLKENSGLSAARNRAILKARGEIVVFSDDDDAATPDYLEQHVKTHDAWPLENFGAFGRITPSPELQNSVINHILTENHGMYNYFGYLNDGDVLDFRHFWGNVVSVKRDFLIRHGLFDETTRAQEDAELGWRLNRHGLRLIHNQSAVLTALRTLTHAQFCRRQKNIGRASAWLTRKYADAFLPHWLGVADAESRHAQLETAAQGASGVVAQLDVLENAGWNAVSASPDWTQTFAALTELCRTGFQHAYLSGYLEAKAEFEASDAANPPPVNSNARVSIVIPCYNYARFLPGAIASLAAQTYANWEAIIVDDGSPDDTISVAEALISQYPNCAIRLISQPNAGHPSHARNHGIRESSGEFVVCLDADDEIAPTFLAETVRLLATNPSLAYAYTDQIRFGENWSERFYAGEYQFEALRDFLPWGICTLFRRSAWEAVGGWKPVGFEDWDFWLSCGEIGLHGRRIAQPLYRYRKHAAGRYLTDERKGLVHKARLVSLHPALFSAAKNRWATGVLTMDDWLADPKPLTNLPLVSVLFTPTMTGDSAGRAAALASLQAQTYASWELCEAADSSVAARNDALQKASGKYLAYLDDASVWEPGHLSALVSFLESAPFRAAYSDLADAAAPLDFDPDHLLVSNCVPGVAVLHERACLLAVGGGFDPLLPAVADWDLWIRLSRTFDFARLPRVTASSHADALPGWAGQTKRLYQKHRKWVDDSPNLRDAQEKVLEQIRPDADDRRVEEAETKWAAGEREAANKLLAQVTQADPGNVRAWNNLGVIAWSDGNLESALAFWSRALEADPDDQTTRQNCADALHALGQEEEARLLVGLAA